MGKAHTTDSAPLWLTEVRDSYDADAPGYAEKVHGLLDSRPHLRAHLDVFAELVQPSGGRVADIGCGTGYVTQYLHDAGAEAFGVDLSSAMVALARREHPDLEFEIGTMTNLALPADHLGGIVAFWSTIHVPDHAMGGVIAEFHRVLRPGGYVLIGFHVGEHSEHETTGYTGLPISMYTHLRMVNTMTDWLRGGHFQIESESLFRPDDEVPGAIVITHKGV